MAGRCGLAAATRSSTGAGWQSFGALTELGRLPVEKQHQTPKLSACPIAKYPLSCGGIRLIVLDARELFVLDSVLLDWIRSFFFFFLKYEKQADW